MLSEVVAALAELSDELTLYAARPWGPGSDAACIEEPSDGHAPTGLSYLLEVFLAKEAVEVWADRVGRVPTTEEACAAITYYAEFDAFMPNNPDLHRSVSEGVPVNDWGDLAALDPDGPSPRSWPIPTSCGAVSPDGCL